MSRFFDALKEASRSRQSTGENPGLLDFDMDGGPVPPVVRRMEILPTVTPETLAAELEETVAKSAKMPEANLDFLPQELLDLASPPVSESVSQSESFGTNTQVVIDKRARLLPFAADSAVVERYRRLRTKILQQQTTKPFRILVVASPGPQEGKTVTVLNLGFSFAMLPSFKVLVVDGDLRKGSIGKWLGVDDQPGLSNLIDGSARLQDSVLKCDDLPLHFMVRGTSKLAAGELLQSNQLSSCFRRMAEHFDLILVDSPPVNLVTDVQGLADASDAILLVARAFSTTRKALEQAVQDLSRFRTIGTVLNGGTRAQLYRRYHNYY